MKQTIDLLVRATQHTVFLKRNSQGAWHRVSSSSEVEGSCLGASAPCFSLEDTADGRIRVTASSMSELTYGIG